jgi:hypothetical protein
MEEVLAIWNSTSSEVKKYIPKVTWDSSEVLVVDDLIRFGTASKV